MPVRIRREIRIALKRYLAMLSRDPGLREPLKYIIEKHVKAMREMQRQTTKVSLQVTPLAATRAALADAAKSGRREEPDVGTPTDRVTVHAPKVQAFLKDRYPAQGHSEETRAVIATVIVVLTEFQQVRVKGPNGWQYAITAKTPGIDWRTLREGQQVECIVTNSDLPRVIQARVCYRHNC